MRSGSESALQADPPLGYLCIGHPRGRQKASRAMNNVNQPPPDLAREEFAALRATIRERGTLRLLVTAITFVSWVTLALLAWRGGVSVPFAALATLLLLAAGFEIVFNIHVGVERVGRYLQARYERPSEGLPRWEHDVMAIGRNPASGGGLDPLFSPVFIAAALLNLAPLLVPGIQWSVPIRPFPRGLTGLWSVVAVVAHVMFIVRVRRASAFAARQRETELEWFSRHDR
jgi:hypothetical protein